MITGFINQKGGCSKSTTAVHFAYWLKIKKRKKVYVIDADEQGSTITWIKAINADIPVAHLTDTDSILDKIPEIAHSTDFVVVDAPASAAETTRAILFICDLAVVPVHPAAIDIHSSTDTFRLIQQAQRIRNGQPTASAFISRAINRTRLKHEAIAFLSSVPNILKLQTVIHQRIAIADAFGQDCTIWELPKATDSQAEFENLFKEIWKLCK